MPMELAWKFTRRHWIAAVFLFASFLISAQIGRELFTAPAVIFPAAGIALAVLYLEGLRLWPVVLLAGLVHYLVGGTAPIFGIGLAVAHTVQAFVGAYALKRLGVNHLLGRMRDMFLFMTVAILSAAIVPTLGTGARYLNHLATGAAFPGATTWGAWWVGGIMSLLILTPFLIRWFGQLAFARTIAQWAEIVLSFTFLVVVTVPLFWMGVSQVFGVSLVYLMLIPLFWISLRLGSRFTTLAILTLTVIAIGGTFFGVPIDPAKLGNRIYQTEIFLDIIAFIFFIVVSLDEERRRATKALETQVAKLQDLLAQLSVRDRAKSDFLAVLAHELRNPLAPVVSSLEILKLTGPQHPDATEAVEIMGGKLKTIQRLLDDLLDVSRISREKLSLQRETMELGAVVKGAAKSVEKQIEERSQTLSLDIPEEPIILHADPVRLEQVVTNLLTNSSKYTESGGAIAVTVRRLGKEAEIRVKDDGIGIEWNMLSRIFEPFMQLERGERRSMGLGIGLALTKNLVEMHEGSIQAQSDGRDQGSEFIIRLPLPDRVPESKAKKEDLKGPEPTLAARVGGRRHILVVDDNEAAAHGIGKLLTLTGYEVTYAYSGRDAIDYAIDRPPYAIVLDIGLPDMDGYKVAEALRSDADFEGILVALTGYGQAEDKQRAYEAGFDYHLVKPIGIAELERVLRKVR